MSSIFTLFLVLTMHATVAAINPLLSIPDDAEIRSNITKKGDELHEFYVALHNAPQSCPDWLRTELAKEHIQTNTSYDVRGSTLLHYAARYGLVDDIVKLITTYNFPVNARNIDGLTPLHFAAYFNHINAIEVLLKNGADIDARTRNFNLTPLMLCIASKLADYDFKFEQEKVRNQPENEANVATVKFLLTQGAGIDFLPLLLSGDYGFNPLDMAIWTNKPKTVALLLEHGADANEVHSHGFSALGFACSIFCNKQISPSVLYTLKWAGAQCTPRDLEALENYPSPRTPEVLALLNAPNNQE